MTEDAVSFSLSAGELTVRDEAGGGNLTVAVEGADSLTPASDAWFDVPVDDAVSVETSSIRFENLLSVFLRDDDGTEHGKVTVEPFEIDSYGTFIDVNAALKLLIYVERGTIRGRVVENDDRPSDTVISFETPTQVVIGARSTHEVPVTSITVTEDPADLMDAVSLLGASVKEWSAERSWPTLRGHPPAIELGAARDIPDSLSVPDTGVTIGTPPDTASIFRVAPLSHYLGADLVPNDRAELRLGSKHAEPLGTGRDLEASVDELLARCLLLDSLVRIGGYYSIPRLEYDELAPELPFYPPELYGESIDQQLLEYLEVPLDKLRPYLPEWSVEATLRPDATDVEVLPYVQHALGRVRVTEDGAPPTRSGGTAALSTTRKPRPGVASVTPGAWEQAIDWDRPATEEASLLFVDDGPDASEAFTKAAWEQFRGGPPRTATCGRTLSTASLRQQLAEGHLYVNYAGGVTSEGLVCTDGVLPFREIPDGAIGVLSIAWRDGDIPESLRDAAVVVALAADPFDSAEARRFGKLLSLGFSPAVGADIARIDDCVRFVGDASRSFVNRQSGSPPTLLRIEQIGDDQYRATAEFSFDDANGLGQINQLVFDPAADIFQLAGTRYRLDGTLSSAEIGGELTYDTIPLFVENTSEAVTADPIEDLPTK